MKRVIVIGGAGYIGSHTAKALAKAGIEPVVFDNLLYGHEEMVKWGPFEKISIQGDLEPLFRKYQPDAVMHFAGSTYVGDSAEKPLLYYENNVLGSFNVLKTIVKTRVIPFVFSSTCAIYGQPLQLPIEESHPKTPISPYGRSKLMVEMMIADFHKAYGLPFAALRYFNAAGSGGDIGERHIPETHLIPLAIEAAIKNQPLKIFGSDYDTPDGTAIRDYVHVNDLADAHIRALGESALEVNLGTGQGYSVKEIITAIEILSGKKIRVEMAPRRAGDPARLVANAAKAKEVLQWSPKHNLEDMIRTAMEWHTKSL